MTVLLLLLTEFYQIFVITYIIAFKFLAIHRSNICKNYNSKLLTKYKQTLI